MRAFIILAIVLISVIGDVAHAGEDDAVAVSPPVVASSPSAKARARARARRRRLLATQRGQFVPVEAPVAAPSAPLPAAPLPAAPTPAAPAPTAAPKASVVPIDDLPAWAQARRRQQQASTDWQGQILESQQVGKAANPATSQAASQYGNMFPMSMHHKTVPSVRAPRSVRVAPVSGVAGQAYGSAPDNSAQERLQEDARRNRQEENARQERARENQQQENTRQERSRENQQQEQRRQDNAREQRQQEDRRQERAREERNQEDRRQEQRRIERAQEERRQEDRRQEDRRQEQRREEERQHH